MSEKVFYDDGVNKVTDKRFIVGTLTHSISNITSVGIQSYDIEPKYQRERFSRPKTVDEIIEAKKEKEEAHNKGGGLQTPKDFLRGGIAGFVLGVIFSFWTDNSMVGFTAGFVLGFVLLDFQKAIGALIIAGLADWFFELQDSSFLSLTIFIIVYGIIIFLSQPKLEVDPNVYWEQDVVSKQGYTMYQVVITSSSAQTAALESKNKGEILKIVDAINNAIISRG